MSLDESVQVVSVTFLAENLLQIQYQEERDSSSAAAMQRSIIMDTEYIEEELEVFLEAARDLVDKGLLLIRNPPQTRKSPRENDDSS